MSKLSHKTCLLIREALCEDIGSGDITTQSLIPAGLKGRAYIEAKSDGVLAGGGAVCEVFRTVDKTLRIQQHVSDGKRFRSGQKVFSIRGRAVSILNAERVALNFLSHLSGVATLTRRFVEKAKGSKAKIYDTRKTTPLWRELEKNAVRAGGGWNHRFGLWDQILVKDNHWATINVMLRRSRNISEQRFFAALRMTLIRLRKRGKFVEIEVQNLKELAYVLPFRPDAVLLDNFSVPQLKKAVRVRRAFRKRPIFEASGGIDLGNIANIAKTGVDRISIGALTHSAPAVDFSLELNL